MNSFTLFVKEVWKWLTINGNALDTAKENMSNDTYIPMQISELHETDSNLQTMLYIKGAHGPEQSLTMTDLSKTHTYSTHTNTIITNETEPRAHVDIITPHFTTSRSMKIVY